MPEGSLAAGHSRGMGFALFEGNSGKAKAGGEGAEENMVGGRGEHEANDCEWDDLRGWVIQRTPLAFGKGGMGSSPH